MIKIETEKIVVRGEQRRKIISVFALTEKELPIEYLDGFPKVYSNGTYLTIRPDQFNIFYLNPTDSPKLEKDFLFQLDILRAAGDRLRDINKKLAEANKDWHGEETFII